MFYMILMLAAIVVGAGAVFALYNIPTDEDPDITPGARRERVAARAFMRTVLFVASLFAVVWTGLNSYTQVNTGHVGVIYQFGSIVSQIPEGPHFILPWRSVREASIQVQSFSLRLEAASKQSQDVFADVTLNWHTSPENIQRLYRDVGPNFFETLVRPRIPQVFKAKTVEYDTLAVLPAREEIRRKTTEELAAQLAANSIVVDDFLLVNLSFGDAYQKEIEATAAATQTAQREIAKVAQETAKANQKIEAARGDAQSVLVNATAQAEANLKLAKSITPELVQYQMVQKLSDKITVMMVPAGQNMIMPAEAFKAQR